MIQIKRTKRFEKSFLKLSNKLQIKTKTVLSHFIENKFEKQLNNHALKGNFIGFRSINISGDIRIIFRERENGEIEIIELFDIGTHSELY